jgi:hypothetical protein
MRQTHVQSGKVHRTIAGIESDMAEFTQAPQHPPPPHASAGRAVITCHSHEREHIKDNALL